MEKDLPGRAWLYTRAQRTCFPKHHHPPQKLNYVPGQEQDPPLQDNIPKSEWQGLGLPAALRTLRKAGKTQTAVQVPPREGQVLTGSLPEPRLASSTEPSSSCPHLILRAPQGQVPPTVSVPSCPLLWSLQSTHHSLPNSTQRLLNTRHPSLP